MDFNGILAIQTLQAREADLAALLKDQDRVLAALEGAFRSIGARVRSQCS